MNRSAKDIDAEVIWLQGVHKHVAFRQLFRELRKRGHGVTQVLDIGCGTGGFLNYAKTHGVSELYGFDASAAQIAVARHISPNVRECISLSEYIRLLGHRPQWDVVTLWDVIEHIREPRPLLTELNESCDARTVVCFCTPNGLSEFIKLKARRALSAPHSFIPWEHVIYYSPEGIRRLLSDHGFEVFCLQSAACYPRPMGIFEMIRRVGFAASRRTALAPQLFVLARKVGG